MSSDWVVVTLKKSTRKKMDFNLIVETGEQALIASVRNTLAEQGEALRHLFDVIDAEAYSNALRLIVG